MRKPTFDTLDAKPLIPPSRAAQLLVEAKARKPWPPETPCYKCGGPVGEPFAPWPTSKPVCPVCAWANIEAALGEGGHVPLCRRYVGDNDGTCPELRCVRDKGHEGPCDNVKGDEPASVSRCAHSSPACDPCVEADTIAAHST